MTSRPSVSVFVMVYNHERYIAEALDGILKQKVDFKYEIVLGEDYSTDKSREIVLQYAQKHQDKFKLFLHTSNIGAIANQIRVLSACTGKYIALCEGDDYWTDPLKLQKQVNFLERNDKYSACFTNATIVNEINNTSSTYVTFLDEGEVALEEIIRMGGYIFPTATLMFRRDILQNNVIVRLLDGLSGDTSLIISAAMHGKVYFLNQMTTVYRRWAGGVYSQVSGDSQLVSDWKIKNINGYKKVKNMVDDKMKKVVQSKISSESLYILRNSKRADRFLYLPNLTKLDMLALLSDYSQYFRRFWGFLVGKK